jgi:hypothetical protein
VGRCGITPAAHHTFACSYSVFVGGYGVGGIPFLPWRTFGIRCHCLFVQLQRGTYPHHALLPSCSAIPCLPVCQRLFVRWYARFYPSPLNGTLVGNTKPAEKRCARAWAGHAVLADVVVQRAGRLQYISLSRLSIFSAGVGKDDSAAAGFGVWRTGKAMFVCGRRAAATFSQTPDVLACQDVSNICLGRCGVAGAL